MMNSLKGQLVSMKLTLGSTLAVLLAFIPYSYLTGGKDPLFFYTMELIALTLLFGLVMHLSATGINVVLNLQMGATRRNWYLSMLLEKLAYTVITVAFGIFVSMPLAMLAFGAPVEIRYDLLLLLFAGSFAGSAIGEFFGYLTARLGMKVFVIALVATIVLGIGGTVLLVILVEFEIIVAFFTGPVILAVAAGITVVFQVLSWFMVRRLPV